MQLEQGKKYPFNPNTLSCNQKRIDIIAELSWTDYKVQSKQIVTLTMTNIGSFMSCFRGQQLLKWLEIIDKCDHILFALQWVHKGEIG